MRKFAFCLALLLALSVANVANAAIIVSLSSVVSNGDGTWTWSYQADLQPDQNMRVNAAPPPPTVNAHDFFTVYDFGGYVAGSINFVPSVGAASNWTWTAQNTGLTLSSPLGGDNPAITNLSVQLSSGSNIVPDPAGSSVTLGMLTARSIFSGRGNLGDYGAQAQKKQNSLTTGNVGFVETPSNPVPEPVTMSLFGTGLLFAGFLGRRMRK